jgi:Ser/Thr protein kinase RdoA (MazF antagonist)
VVVSTANRYVFHGRHDGHPVYVKSRRRADPIAGEVRMLQAAIETGAPVADLVAHLPGRPAVMVTEAVSGRPLHATSSEQDWVVAGRALRRLHAWGQDDTGRADVDPEAWAQDLARMVLDELREARRTGRLGRCDIGTSVDRALDVILGSMPAGLTTIHGDCMPKHLILDDGGGAAFIDFDAAGVGDPRFDLAVLTTYAPERLDALLAGYGIDGHDVRAGVQAYWIVRLLRSLNWLADHGYDPDAARERLIELAAEIDRPRRRESA